jgi:serine/threonine protein kinase
MDRANFIGQTLGGRYRIDELLGQGGMATVYKAYDPNLKRTVAVKVIKTGLADDPKFLARFEAEAGAVAQLRHRNIVQVFDFSHDDDLYYMVQEFIAGETLHDHLRRLNQAGRAMPLDKVIAYTIDVCDAAGYAHRRGMIHRDIKPANIMLDVHDQAILMDFGIVKIADSVEHTVTGAVVGTARYMPPELIRGEVPDARSDIYSLGITLYEMIGGQPPFDANSAMTLLMMHLQDPVPDVRVRRPDVPPALGAVIGKALAKDREMRYGTMAAMAIALKGVREAMATGQPLYVQATEIDESEDGGVDASSTRLDAPPEPAGATPPPGTPGWSPGAAGSAGQTPPPGTPGWGPGAAGSAGQTPPPGTPGWGPGAAGSAGQTPPPGTPGWGPGAAAAAPGQKPRLALPGSRRMWMGLGALLLAVALGLGFLAARGLGSGGGQETPQAAGPAAAAAASATPGAAPTTTPAPSNTPTAPSSAPAGGAAYSYGSATPAPEAPTPAPAGSVTITAIEVDAQGNYVVDFAADGFTPAYPGTHIHFYFNTFSLDQVGIGGDANRRAWGAPPPFDGYAAADRPDGAAQLCAVVANPDHSVRPGSGNCATLPDVATVSSSQGLACRFGPGDTYPATSELPANLPALLQGLSADEQWWNVVNPQDPGNGCWLPVLGTEVSGDISRLPMIEPPPPETVPSAPSVEIAGISLDDQGNYVVDFAVDGFTPAYPGTHIHFYFNTFTPEQVGIGGEANRRAWGAPPPFDGYASSDRPVGATELCAIVANPNHSVIADSGNCVRLPGLPTVQITGIGLDAQKNYVVDFGVDGFTPAYPGTHIHFYFNTFTLDQVGIGGDANRRAWGAPPPFNGYTAADRPEGATMLCAVVADPNHSVLAGSGNCFPLPDVMAVEITAVTVDGQGHYVVDYVTWGFTLHDPGTHVHFYFDTESPEHLDQLGMGHRYSSGNTQPFTGLTTDDRPEGATQMCATVVRPDNSVVTGSGNCFPLPGAQGNG